MKTIKYIFTLFIIWRICLFFVAFSSNYLISQFGARFPYYNTALEPTGLPNWIWGFGNFDGVHYLRLAQDGYTSKFSQSFFPVYPLLIRFLNVIPKNPAIDTRTFVDPSYFYTGLILSNLFFLGFLVFFYKLLKLDYSEKIAKLSLVLVLVFPTSFYLGSIYTESLFLMLTVASIYCFRTKKYFLAGILAAIASATKIFGVFIQVIFLIEMFMNRKNIKTKELGGQILGFVLAPLGLFAYMFYLNKNFGDALLFLNSQPGFGAGRSSQAYILLPQVIFRYIKMFLTVKVTSLPFWNALLEFIFTLIPLSLLAIFFKKIRSSYLWFSFLVLILPTLTGTLSSMPRYALVAFPIFPLLASTPGRHFRLLVIILTTVQIILLSMFIRGYWVA